VVEQEAAIELGHEREAGLAEEQAGAKLDEERFTADAVEAERAEWSSREILVQLQAKLDGDKAVQREAVPALSLAEGALRDVCSRRQSLAEELRVLQSHAELRYAHEAAAAAGCLYHRTCGQLTTGLFNLHHQHHHTKTTPLSLFGTQLDFNAWGSIFTTTPPLPEAPPRPPRPSSPVIVSTTSPHT